MSHDWRSGRLEYTGNNIASQLHWPDLTQTKGQVATSGKFLLVGYEYNEDLTTSAPALHQLSVQQTLASTEAGASLDGVIKLNDNAIVSLYSLGLQYAQEGAFVRLLFEPVHRSVELSIHSSLISLSLQSHAIDVSKSQLLTASFSLQKTF